MFARDPPPPPPWYHHNSNNNARRRRCRDNELNLFQTMLCVCCLRADRKQRRSGMIVNAVFYVLFFTGFFFENTRHCVFYLFIRLGGVIGNSLLSHCEKMMNYICCVDFNESILFFRVVANTLYCTLLIVASNRFWDSFFNCARDNDFWNNIIETTRLPRFFCFQFKHGLCVRP